MSSDHFDTLISEYRACAKIHAECDFSDKASVRRSNRAAQRMSEIVLSLLGSTNALQLFAALLNETEWRTNLWAAHHLLEDFRATGAIADQAIGIIENASRSNDLNSYGEKVWLDRWRAAHAP